MPPAPELFSCVSKTIVGNNDLKKEPQSHHGCYGLIRRSRKENDNSSLLLGARGMKCPALSQPGPTVTYLAVLNLLMVRETYDTQEQHETSCSKKTGGGVARFAIRT